MLVGSRLLKKEPIRNDDERYACDIRIFCVFKSICHRSADIHMPKIWIDAEARNNGMSMVLKIAAKLEKSLNSDLKKTR
jgi:hypothetical protein